MQVGQAGVLILEMNEEFSYDFVVVGGGSAGYAAARTAATHGLKTAVIEGGGEVGGLCILRGCMPSKTLLESATRAQAAREAAAFGIHIPNVATSVQEVIARKRKLIAEFAGYRREQLEQGPFDFFRGHASFTGPDSLAVTLLDGGQISIFSSYILIAVGSRGAHPEITGLGSVGALTSDEILDAVELPHSVVVLGAGPVALEMAYYMHAMGTKVTIIQRGKQFLSGTDPDLAAVIEDSYREAGMEIHSGTKLLRVDRAEGDGIRVHFEKDGEICEVGAAAVFNGLGRIPNVAGLGLDAAGVALENCMVSTRATQQTTVPNIFAAGDCCGPYEIVHLAIQQGEVAARNAERLSRGEGNLEEMDYRLKFYAVFTEPQFAMVGLGEEEAKKKGIPYRVATYPFGDHGKSLVMGALKGFVKLIADPETGEILGGGIVGPHAAELIHEIAVAMAFRSTAAQLAAVPHYHPTLSEIWTYPAEELAG